MGGCSETRQLRTGVTLNVGGREGVGGGGEWGVHQQTGQRPWPPVQAGTERGGWVGVGLLKTPLAKD